MGGSRGNGLGWYEKDYGLDIIPAFGGMMWL
jgi:hypothetical protein